MTEWISLISLAVSILGLLLERDKFERLYTDFYSWQSQRREKQKGEQFIRKLNPVSAQKSTSARAFLLPLLFLLTLSSGLVGLFNLKTLVAVCFAGTLPLTVVFWFSIRGLIQQTQRLQLTWPVTVYTIFMFQVAIIGFGLLWGIFALLFIEEGVPSFWAGMAGAVTFLIMVSIMFLIGKRIQNVR